MIIILKQDAPDAQVREFCHELTSMGFEINDSKGRDTHILGLIGDTKAIAESWVLANPVVETVRRVSEPYKKWSRRSAGCPSPTRRPTASSTPTTRWWTSRGSRSAAAILPSSPGPAASRARSRSPTAPSG